MSLQAVRNLKKVIIENVITYYVSNFFTGPKGRDYTFFRQRLKKFIRGFEIKVEFLYTRKMSNRPSDRILHFPTFTGRAQ